MSSNSQLSAPKKLLSLDGGRVRGISSMVILREIMNKVKELEQGKKIGDDSERLPCRYFDLAGGASTGGLAAIMLFRLEMSAPDVIDQYEGMATRIFSKKDEGPFHENGSSTGNWVRIALKVLLETPSGSRALFTISSTGFSSSWEVRITLVLAWSRP